MKQILLLFLASLLSLPALASGFDAPLWFEAMLFLFGTTNGIVLVVIAVLVAIAAIIALIRKG